MLIRGPTSESHYLCVPLASSTTFVRLVFVASTCRPQRCQLQAINNPNRGGSSGNSLLG